MEAVGPGSSPAANRPYASLRHHSPTYAQSSRTFDTAQPANVPDHLRAVSPTPSAYQPQYTPAAPASAPPAATIPSPSVEPAAPKQRRKRQPPNSDTASEQKEKKPRKPREPRDPSEPSRKRAKKEVVAAHTVSTLPTEPQQLHFQGSLSNAYPPHPNSLPPAVSDGRDPSVSMMSSDRLPPQPARPSTSGQRYDPIRAASAENASHPYAPAPTIAPPKSSNYMSMILNGPSSPASASRQLPPSAPHSESHGTASQRHATPSSPRRLSGGLSVQAKVQDPVSAVPIDLPVNDFKTNGVAKAPRNSVSPRPPRQSPKPATDQPKSHAPGRPPLLSSSALISRAGEKPREYAEVTNQCIVIEIPMSSGGSSYVNFMKEVEQKYGFDVAHPQVAEHRRRMKDMAAAGALLESGVGSSDEMNLDNSDAGSDAEMGGMDDGSAPEGTKKRRQRNDYDKEDDFIDDTELAWEEQALASKDGYFVWSGPLVQEGDKTTIERADGTMKRGRGSGRGRGGSIRGDGSSGRGRGGGGRGSRGGQTVRKPRVTKADRARMESEKQERERMAATASKPVAPPVAGS